MRAQIQKKTLTKYDIQSLQNEIIFNCTGMGSASIFEDNKMYAVKGQLLYF
jgi:hypothetical protein